MTQASPTILNHQLKPLCSRDDHVMRYESRGSRANTGNFDSYHCASGDCSVRYNAIDGYFTLLGATGQTYPVNEPGVNTLQCPVHGGWLYRKKNPNKETGSRWSCGVESCDYSYKSETKGHWVRT